MQILGISDRELKITTIPDEEIGEPRRPLSESRAILIKLYSQNRFEDNIHRAIPE